MSGVQGCNRAKSLLLQLCLVILQGAIKDATTAPARPMAHPRNSVIFSFDKPVLVGPVNYFDGMWVPIPAPSERMIRSHPKALANSASPIAFDGDIFYTTNSELLDPVPYMQGKARMRMRMRPRPVNHFVPFGRASKYHIG